MMNFIDPFVYLYRRFFNDLPFLEDVSYNCYWSRKLVLPRKNKESNDKGR